jgi:signal transduction histidine kinase
MATSVIASLEEALSSLGGVDSREVAALAGDAETRALARWQAAGAGPEAATLAATAYVGEMIGGLALVHEWKADEIEALVEDLAHRTGRDRDVTRFGIYAQALAHLHESGLPPRLVLAGCLQLLAAFAPVAEASLWMRDAGTLPRCVAVVGAECPTRRVRAAAREILNGAPERRSERGFVHAVAVLRWGHPYGALVVRARPADREQALALAREAAVGLASAIERDLLLDRSTRRERTLVDAAERRLARLAFDIHDGPIQDAAALAGDLQLFRRQLEIGLPANAPRELLLGRVEDFRAQLFALDRELRELAHSFERRSIGEQPFADVLRRHIAAFTTRNDITVKLDLRGDTESLSTSQRLALLAVVREALTNVRDHSGGSEALVTLFAGRAHTHATVVDNGHGFDVERTLARAARRGRLGLVGMGERIRLLGGRLSLDSGAGGPTTVSVTVPRWDPLAATSIPRVA